ncbi:hypothetical protein [Polymorphospora lycopeni]|uniref:Integral membrane protein n=1 Tax=Polymorphospora lycopeni TaxID=3140240 RepID=A0ABV5CT71_9ACTN
MRVDSGRSAYLVMLGWHGLMVVAYLVLVYQVSGTGELGDNSPREDMLVFGAYVIAPALVATLLVGLLLLRWLPARSRTSSAVVLGTAAASPALLLAAAVAGLVLR